MTLVYDIPPEDVIEELRQLVDEAWSEAHNRKNISTNRIARDEYSERMRRLEACTQWLGQL